MMKRLSVIAILSLLVFAFLSMTAMAAKYPADKYVWQKRINVTKLTKAKLAGGETPLGYAGSSSQTTQSLGADAIVSNSPGIDVGTTTYDLQSNCRMTREVDWRGTQSIHFVWMFEADSLEGSDPNSVRVTRYEVYDPGEGGFIFEGAGGGGTPIHADAERSGYCGLDVDENSKVVIHNHSGTNANDMSATLWFDWDYANAFFSPGKNKIPDSLMEYGVDAAGLANGDGVFLWPYAEYQVWGADTVTHVFAQQSENKDPEASFVHYFRHTGHPYVDSLGGWDYPPIIVDTIPTISQIVTASRVSPKVALVWQAPPGGYPGDPESWERDWVDDGLGVNQRINDVFILINDSIGDPGSWGSKQNISAYDSTVGGWLGHGDMSALYDTGDNLHIVWNAREIVPSADGNFGEYTNFYGARILHWDQANNEIRPVVDANWDLLQYDEDGDTVCTGGAWNEMSLVKPMLSECEGKFYVVFVQFQDLWNGVYNDCAEARFSGGAGYSGTANGELYLSVSDNGGYNWDAARNLTDTYTPFCYSDEAEGTPVCEADHYPSMPRYGQLLDGANFDMAAIVDPSDGDYGGDYYLDVFYVNDKFPGAALQDAGIWTTNPVKWFRIPCVEPVVAPDLAYSPSNVGEPTWTHPGRGQLDTLLRLENVGNAPLVIDSIVTRELNGPTGWLDVSKAGPLTISHITPTWDTLTIQMNKNGVITTTPSVVRGYVVVYSNSGGEPDEADSVRISLIVADTVMFPEVADIRTSCKRISYTNAGELGDGGGPNGNGGYNMDFFDDCDTTNNQQGEDDHAKVYLYSASPFLSYAASGDTTLNSAMFDATWLSDEGFRPQVSPTGDSSNSDYQYGYSGEFLSKDSTVGMGVEIYAPLNADTCDFIITVQKFYMKDTTDSINDVYLGDFFDWDIPSDSNSENGSGFDASRKMMYCYGAEYGTDTGIYAPNNDCVLADQRYGGASYYGGWTLPMGEADSFPNPQAMWTHMNADWVYPAGGFVAGEMYQKLTATYGYQPWQSTNPTLEDSLYQDLHMVMNFGQFDLTGPDTLIFFKIIITEYDGGVAGLEASHTQALEWIQKIIALYRPTGQCCYGPDMDNTSCADETRDECEARADAYKAWDITKTCEDECVSFVCDCIPGDANGTAPINIFDVTYLISYLYKGGPAPTPYPICSGDPNGLGGPNCVCNIFDVTYLISFLYKGGPAPVDCDTWIANCGMPLRK